MSAKNNSDKDNQSLADKRAKLESILAELEAGEVPIEQVADRLKSAAALAEEIEHELREHKSAIEVLKQRFDGEV